MSVPEVEDYLYTYEEAMRYCPCLEFPLPTRAQGDLRKRRESRKLKSQILSFEEIQEVEEEGVSPTEEENARRCFLQSLESLRRSSNHSHLHKERLGSYKTSLDSSDSDSTL